MMIMVKTYANFIKCSECIFEQNFISENDNETPKRQVVNTKN